MNKRLLITFLISTVSCLYSQNNENYLLLDDCEDNIKWSCNVTEVVKTNDASQGKSAVSIKVDEPLEVEFRFDALNKSKIDLSQYDLLAFDYKLSEDIEILDLVIRQYPLNGGRKANFFPIDQADPREKWSTKIVPLDGPENLSIHIEDFDPEKRDFFFRFTSVKPMSLSIDNVRVMKNPLGINPITFGKYYRRKDGSVLYQYRIEVSNSGKETITVNLTPDTSKLKDFDLKLGLDTLSIAPGDTERCNISILIPAEAVKSSIPFRSEEAVINVSPVDIPQMALPTRLIASIPPKEFVHPSLIGTEKQIKQIPEKIEKYPELEKIWDKVLKVADESIKDRKDVPDYNGAGQTKCYVDNTKLRPIQRTGVPFKEYICDTCGRVYHGKRFDSGFSGAGGWYGTHMKLTDEVVKCAFIYRVTGDLRYGFRAVEIMNGYTEKYLTYDMLFANDKYYPLASNSSSSRRICGWHFMENHFLQLMSVAYDLLKDTEVLSDKDASEFCNNVLLPAARKTTSNEVGLNNIQLPHSMAQISSGFALDDPVLVYYGTMEARGVLSNIRHNILDDGTWSESPNYINLVAHHLPQFLYTLHRIGLPAYTDQVMKLFTEPPKMANPQNYQPNFGDGSGVNLKAWGQHALIPWFDTKDPELEQIVANSGGQAVFGGHFKGLKGILYLMAFNEEIPDKKDDKKLGCTDFPGSGYLFLRNEPEDLWFAMTYGRHVGHGHWDKFGFELYGKGALQAVDDGAGPYDKYHSEFNVRTLAHSTVVVDMKNMNPAPGRKLQWDVDGKVKIASVGSHLIYNGVWYERNVIMFPQAVLLVDHLASDKKRTFDWTYHNLGSIKECPEVKKTQKLAEKGMYSYLKDLKAAKIDQNIQILFRQGTNKWEKAGTGLQLTQIGQASTTLYTAATGHGYKHKHIASTILSRRKAKQTNYVTLLEPLAKDEDPVYKIVKHKQTGNTISVAITDDKQTWTINVTTGDTKNKVKVK